MLEIAHGTGNLLLDLISLGFKPVGLDLSPAMGRIASRKLTFERSDFDFEYPLLTQTAEIALDEMTMALEIRPRSTETTSGADRPSPIWFSVPFHTCLVAIALLAS